MSGVSLPDLNLVNAECRLVTEALARTDSLVAAAKLLGTNRHALRRLITKHDVQWWPYAQQQETWRRPAQRSRASRPRAKR